MLSWSSSKFPAVWWVYGRLSCDFFLVLSLGWVVNSHRICRIATRWCGKHRFQLHTAWTYFSALHKGWLVELFWRIFVGIQAQGWTFPSGSSWSDNIRANWYQFYKSSCQDGNEKVLLGPQWQNHSVGPSFVALIYLMLYFQVSTVVTWFQIGVYKLLNNICEPGI